MSGRPYSQARPGGPLRGEPPKPTPLIVLALDGLVAVALLWGAALAPAPAGSTGSPRLVASPKLTLAGGAVLVQGTGFGHLRRGYLTLDRLSSTSASFVANATGAFSTALPVPSAEAQGTHVLVAADAADHATIVSTNILVINPSAAPNVVPSPLPALAPSRGPSPTPSPSPTPRPTSTHASTPRPTSAPSSKRTPAPTRGPAPAPTVRPTPAPTPARVVKPISFDEEFNGSGVNWARWGRHWTKGSEASYDHAQSQVANGVLTINATRTATGWKSDLIDTWGKWKQKYGYFEARLRFNSGDGLWPAFWLAEDWTSGHTNELDINETLANPPSSGRTGTSMRYYATVHYDSPTTGKWSSGSYAYKSRADLANAWHTYGMDWRADHVTFYIDGIAWKTFTDAAHIPSVAMPVILNLALGGGWCGATDAATPNPSYMQVDWVRVTQ